MNTEIKKYNDQQIHNDNNICELLAIIITQELPVAESKIWHRQPVWFLDSNPITGYKKEKKVFA